MVEFFKLGYARQAVQAPCRTSKAKKSGGLA